MKRKKRSQRSKDKQTKRQTRRLLETGLTHLRYRNAHLQQPRPSSKALRNELHRLTSDRRRLHATLAASVSLSVRKHVSVTNLGTIKYANEKNQLDLLATEVSAGLKDTLKELVLIGDCAAVVVQLWMSSDG